MRILHQIWWQGKDSIPTSYPNYSKQCIKQNKDFEYILWDEAKIKELINQYPKYKSTFDSLPHMIQKIDMAKYLVLHKYGGIYVDMDCECIKPFIGLLQDAEVMLVRMNVNPFEKFLSFGKCFGDAIQNGVMGSKQSNHPFWLHCLDTLAKQDMSKKVYETHLRYVFRTTGPGLLTEAYLSYPNKAGITLVPYDKIDPVSWCDYEVHGCSNNNCSQYFPQAYSIHHFGSKHKTNNWSSDFEQKLGIFCCRNKKIIYSLLAILIVGLIVKYISKV